MSHLRLKILSTPSLGITELGDGERCVRYVIDCLSTPSLGITAAIKNREVEESAGTFNSLSRDHRGSGIGRSGRWWQMTESFIAFNSLSRDHMLL